VSRVIIGYDGSEAASAALAEGAAQAEMRGVPIEVVTAWTFPAVSTPYPISLDPQIFERDAKKICDDGVRWLHERYPQVEVTSRVIGDDPRNALVDATTEDDLLVVATRGRGGVGRMLLGSVAAHCVRGAPCPVLVVRPKAQ
jgi:nucleotide-binding universal stress UspA family protein